MRTVILGERPKELEALIESRRATGADLYDEVWEGDYHMNPAPRIAHAKLAAEWLRLLGRLADTTPDSTVVDAFNVGEPNDYPDSRTSDSSNRGENETLCHDCRVGGHRDRVALTTSRGRS